MNFSNDYVEKTTRLLKEAFKLKKYLAMPPVLAILVGIFMLPVALISAGLAIIVYILGYILSVANIPAERLHNLLHTEGQSVKHATQALVYLISWGAIFATYTSLTVLMVILTVLYSLLSIFTYLWTLGGFKFHLYADEEDISIEVQGEYNIVIPVIFIVVMAALLLIVPLFASVSVLIDLKPEITIDFLKTLFMAKMQETSGLRFLFSILYSAIAFAPFPKKNG